jgi:hypothetical protein
MIARESAGPGRACYPAPLADELKFLMVLNDGPTAWRHIVGPVRKALLEAKLRAELEDELLTAAGAWHMPAALIAREKARLDLRRALYCWR